MPEIVKDITGMYKISQLSKQKKIPITLVFYNGKLFRNSREGRKVINRIFPFQDICWQYCQPQAKAKAKGMPGRLYIHTINNKRRENNSRIFPFQDI